ncbi:helix-turn-helix domain-containing protein [Burkholderia ubonensis]|uniref:helix-turn-helix domain-containing protein n=1 Tax=Burkholderia ubonensis TaxID=101571 RepID=UPI001C42F6AE|nr:helix-turn-helix domain-containing protein [Burkholderia ubonensis]
MKKQKGLELSPEDRCRLEQIVKRGTDWREREWPQTRLYFANGWVGPAIARKLGRNLDTVYDCRKRWLQTGWEAVRNKKAGGAPSKLTAEHRALLHGWIMQDALTTPQLQAKLLESSGLRVAGSTISNALKQMGIVWKRTRHTLKKKRDETRFRAAKAEIEELKAAAKRGDIELAYVDETGFAQAHPN